MNNLIDSPFLASLARTPVTHSPIWLMRQAGRYLPEYRRVREQAGSFLNLCKNPELACSVTLQPLRRFNLDAAILFSDILVVPEAMGLQLYFNDGEGPKFANPLRASGDVDKLKVIAPNEDLNYVMATIHNLKQELPKHIPLIGFSGSPWTLACYMLEGGSSKNYEQIKAWLYGQPHLLHSLLTKISLAVADYLVEQIKAGVNTIMLFDSWGGILSQAAFAEFSQAYLAQVLTRVNAQLPATQQVPTIVFTKGGGAWISLLDQLPCTSLGIDWTLPLSVARTQTDKVLQGNLDPVLLSVADRDCLVNEVKRIITDYRRANQDNLDGHIFNLGHGILPSAKPDNVALLVDTVHELTSR